MGGNCTTDQCDELTATRLCDTCTGHLRRHLRDVVELALAAELHRAAHRQTRLTRAADTVGRPSGSYPLPVDLDAADTAAALVDTFTTWVRHVADNVPNPAPMPPRIPTPLAAWLADHIDQIRTLPEAGELLDEVAAITRAAIRTVDLPETSILAGACPECAHPVYARTGAVHGQCRAPGCEGTVRVDQGRADHLDTLDTTEHTAADAARIMTALGEPVTRQLITKWHQRGDITPASWAPARSTTGRARPRFRIGALRARLRRTG